VDVYLTIAFAGAAVLVSGFVWLLPHRVVVSYWALGLALFASGVAGAYTVLGDDDSMRWALLGLGAGFAVAAWACRQMGIIRAAGAAGAIAALSTYIASMMGASQTTSSELTSWHALLTAAVVAAIMLGAYVRIPEIATAGGIGALLWLGLAVPLISEDPAWAVAVIVFGLGLALATAAMVRRRQPRSPVEGGPDGR
jgi:hypothetical protein